MSNIVIVKTDKYYYPKADFRPSRKYPEYLFDEISKKDNHVYDMIRKWFLMMKLDIKNYWTYSWNPLWKFIEKWNKVVVKPNLVMDYNPTWEGVECLYTQPSIVAAIVDYVIIALKWSWEIVIWDAPMQECNFEKLISESWYDKLIEFYHKKLKWTNIKIKLEDFRELKTICAFWAYKQNIVDDTLWIVVDLGNDSEFSNLTEEQFKNLRITNYDPSILNSHHNAFKNEYYINKTILEADAIINVPKPKTHRKAWVTIALKNLIWINARKEYLPHHMNWSKIDNKWDEYLLPSYIKRILDKIIDIRNKLVNQKKHFLSRLLFIFRHGLTMIVKFFSKDKFFEWSRYGNNTISKTIIDLNKIVRYADKNWKMSDKIQRNYFIVADMIISWEKEWPIAPSPKNVWMIAMWENPIYFDETIWTLMWAKMESNPTILCAKKSMKKWKLYNENDKIFITSNDKNLDSKTIKQISKKEILYFEPSEWWRKVFLKNN